MCIYTMEYHTVVKWQTIVTCEWKSNIREAEQEGGCGGGEKKDLLCMGPSI